MKADWMKKAVERNAKMQFNLFGVSPLTPGVNEKFVHRN